MNEYKISPVSARIIRKVYIRWRIRRHFGKVLCWFGFHKAYTHDDCRHHGKRYCARPGCGRKDVG
jgi:hypothetical protein